jgi:hypothetical protein
LSISELSERKEALRLGEVRVEWYAWYVEFLEE